MKKFSLEERYELLDDVMKLYFRQETMIRIWNRNAGEKNKEIADFNANKHWWQRKKTGHYPSYYTTPIKMPILFTLPPTWHPEYKKTKKLIEDYCEDTP